MFTNISYLQLLWLLPILALLCVWTARRRNRLVARTAGQNATAALRNETPSTSNALRIIAFFASLALLIIALAGPAWDPVEEKIDRQGRDVVFVLDVSRSMLAEDLRPSRLERAKADVADCISALQGDRVALVAFAGNAAVQCPLTQDYGFFRMMLADLSPDSVSRGGTNLGDALRLVQKQVFDDTEKEFKDIILITDGEDHDSLPINAAQELGEAGVRLIAIGIGDDTVGSPIQVTDERGYKSTLKYRGEVVYSKLDSQTLREMAKATPGGVYLPVGTNAFDLKETYLRLIASAAQKDLSSETVVRLQPKFQIFLAIAMLLLAIATLVPKRRRTALLPLVALLLAATPSTVQAKPAPSASTVPSKPKESSKDEAIASFQAGLKALRNNNYDIAIQEFENTKQLEKQNGHRYKEVEFNLALAYYRRNATGDLEEAKERLNEARDINRNLDQNLDQNRDFITNCKILLGNIDYLLARTAYEEAFQALSSQDSQVLQQALQSVKNARKNISQTIDSFNKVKRQRLSREVRRAVQNTQQKSRFLRKELIALEKELEDKLKELPQDQQHSNDQQSSDQQQSNDNQHSQDTQQSQQQQSQDQHSDDVQQAQSSEQQQADEQQAQSSEQQQSQDDQAEEQQSQNPLENEAQQEPKSLQLVKEDDQEPQENEVKPLDLELQQIINAEKQRRSQQRLQQNRQKHIEKDW